MCGIFGYVGTRPNAPQVVLDGLKVLEYRGYDSWGVAAPGNKNIDIDKHVGKISVASTQLNGATMALGHTRWATHGGVTQENSHPHLDCQASLALIHNGIIENYQELKENLSQHKFLSQTDSEVAVHMIEDKLKQVGVLDATRSVFNRIHGLNAFVVMSQSEDKLVVAKNGSPIVIGVGKGENFIASDAAAIIPYTKELIFLEDGQLAELTKKGVKIFTASTGEENIPEITTVDWETEVSELDDYHHFMMKEIFEQPRVIRNIATTYSEQVELLAKQINQAFGTYFIGCGTAGNAALTGTYLFNRIAKQHVNFSFGSEFNYLEDFLTDRSLIIALSQSGETIDVIEPVTRAKKNGVRLASITNNLGSSLYRLSDCKILLGAGPEKSVCATKSYTAKLAVLTLLAYFLEGKIDEGGRLLMKTADDIEKVLTDKYQKKIIQLVSQIKDHSHIYIIGRGLNYPSALEAALKIKEVSYIHAEGFAGGELKHGVIALIEKGTPCIIYAPNDETYDAMISNAMELKARGAYIIGISSKPNDVFDTLLDISDVGDASPILGIVPAQLLAYHLAVSLGYDPDKPRNLAKSVTVK